MTAYMHPSCWLRPVLLVCLLAPLACSTSTTGLGSPGDGGDDDPSADDDGGTRRRGGMPTSTGLSPVDARTVGQTGDIPDAGARLSDGSARDAPAASPDAAAPKTDAAKPTPSVDMATATPVDARLACAAGTADCNGDPRDGCEAKLDDEASCGLCGRRCAGATPICAPSGATFTCQNPVEALDGERWEVPCGEVFDSDELCHDFPPKQERCPEEGAHPVAKTLRVGGRKGDLFQVKLRLRGVVEPKVYMGGTALGDHLYSGGVPRDTNYNTYALSVSAPASVYYLNHDEGKGETHTVFAIDETLTLRIEGGATVKLDTTDPDCALVRNCMEAKGNACKPIVVAGVPPAPMPYNGQFVQVDVVSITSLP